MNRISVRLTELVSDLQALRGEFRMALAAAVRETACRATGDAIDRLWPHLAPRSSYPPQRRYHDDPWQEDEEPHWREDSSFQGEGESLVLSGSRKTPFFVLVLFALVTSAVMAFLRPPLKAHELLDLFLSLRAATLD